MKQTHHVASIRRSLAQLLLSASLISLSSLSHAETAAPPSSSSSPPVAGEAAPRDVEGFWTPDRLRNAKPVEIPPQNSARWPAGRRSRAADRTSVARGPP